MFEFCWLISRLQTSTTAIFTVDLFETSLSRCFSCMVSLEDEMLEEGFLYFQRSKNGFEKCGCEQESSLVEEASLHRYRQLRLAKLINNAMPSTCTLDGTLKIEHMLLRMSIILNVAKRLVSFSMRKMYCLSLFRLLCFWYKQNFVLSFPRCKQFDVSSIKVSISGQ